MLTDQTEQIAADHVLGNERYRLLGARLHELRRMHGLSLKAVADAVNVSPSFLSIVERGQTYLSLSRFTRLTEFYKVIPSELLLELDSNYHEPEISHVTDFQAFDRGAGADRNRNSPVLVKSSALRPTITTTNAKRRRFGRRTGYCHGDVNCSTPLASPSSPKGHGCRQGSPKGYHRWSATPTPARPSAKQKSEGDRQAGSRGCRLTIRL